MKTIEIECVIARYWNWRTNIIVPNVSWGLDLHECDMLIVSNAGYATEVEIKVSKSDLLKDFEKAHGHFSPKIKNFFYAVPESLKEIALEKIPITAGLLVCVKSDSGNVWVEKVRDCIKNKHAKPLDEKEVRQLLRLGCMRIWGLKYSLINYIIDKSKQVNNN